METLRKLKAIGLMSGTSIDGVDAALVETDGVDIFANNFSLSRHYNDTLKNAIRSLLGEKGTVDRERVRKIEVLLTMFHIQAVKDLLIEADEKIENIDVIGFHGHTIFHNPAYHITRQIGDATIMANELNVPVVSRFRNVDVKAGGEGAPLEPAYLMAISENMPKPLGMINIGGVANITIIGENGEMLAFHTGPGNALIDDWMRKRQGVEMDFDGLFAAKGTPNEKIIANLLKDDFFSKKPPKSLDRDYFFYALNNVDGLSVYDGAATLTAFTAAAIADGVKNYLPVKPLKWIVYGGGANNPSMIRYLRNYLQAPVENSNQIGWNGNTLEAQSFAFLAVRSLFGLALTFPNTTGVAEPSSGGKVFYPEVTG